MKIYKQQLSYLFKHSKQHFATEIAKCWGFVGVYRKWMWTNFYIFVPKRLHINYNLYSCIFLNISYCIYHLETKVREWLSGIFRIYSFLKFSKCIKDNNRIEMNIVFQNGIRTFCCFSIFSKINMLWSARSKKTSSL